MAMLSPLLLMLLVHHVGGAIEHSFRFDNVLSQVNNGTSHSPTLQNLLHLLKQHGVESASLHMSRPTGAMLDVSFRTRIQPNRYTLVKQIVANVFCSSLSSGADSLHIKPYIYAPPSHYQEFFPYEVSCTENLNAFINLLPHNAPRMLAMKENNSEWFVLAPSNSLMFKTSFGDGDNKDVVDIVFSAGMDGNGGNVSNGLVVNRYLRKSNGYSSQVITVIENNGSNTTNFSMKEVVADFYDLLLTTYVICLNEEQNNCKSVYTLPSFQLSQDPRCFTAIDWAFELPPYHRLRATYSIALHFPHKDVLPDEPNRGYLIPPAIVTTASQTYRTGALLCRAPLSDLSMAFNVATLTSTVVAFVVGALLNTVTKTSIIEHT